MNKTKIMPWVDVLPNVTETNFQARRDEVSRAMAHAAELARKASEMARQAEALRSRAYQAACMVEGDAKARWSIQIVETAKQNSQ
jgi:Uncharacterized KorC regulated protein A